MSDRIGAAVLGLGVGRMHAQAYDQLDTTELSIDEVVKRISQLVAEASR